MSGAVILSLSPQLSHLQSKVPSLARRANMTIFPAP